MRATAVLIIHRTILLLFIMLLGSVKWISRPSCSTTASISKPATLSSGQRFLKHSARLLSATQTCCLCMKLTSLCVITWETSFLHQAARRGFVKHASLFLDQGIKFNVWNAGGMTPLHLATKCGHYEVADLLLRKNAAVDVCGKAD